MPYRYKATLALVGPLRKDIDEVEADIESADHAMTGDSIRRDEVISAMRQLAEASKDLKLLFDRLDLGMQRAIAALERGVKASDLVGSMNLPGRREALNGAAAQARIAQHGLLRAMFKMAESEGLTKADIAPVVAPVAPAGLADDQGDHLALVGLLALVRPRGQLPHDLARRAHPDLAQQAREVPVGRGTTQIAPLRNAMIHAPRILNRWPEGSSRKGWKGPSFVPSSSHSTAQRSSASKDETIRRVKSDARLCMKETCSSSWSGPMIRLWGTTS